MINKKGFQFLIGYDAKIEGVKNQIHRYAKNVDGIGEINMFVVLGQLGESTDDFLKELDSINEVFIPANANWAIVYSIKDHNEMAAILYDNLKIDGDEFSEITKSKLYGHFSWINSDLRSLIETKESKKDIKCQIYAKPDQIKILDLIYEEEEGMAGQDLIAEFWRGFPELKKIMLHAYLIQASQTKKAGSIYSDVKRRVGENRSTFDIHVDTLEKANILENGGSCYLRPDTSAFDTVAQFVSDSYHIDQKIGEISGTRFLNLAFDGRQGSMKEFAEAIRADLLSRVPYIRCIEIKKNPYIYEFFLPGKWFTLVACKTSSSPIGEGIVALLDGHRSRINSWLVMKSAFALVIGSEFSGDSVEMAEVKNVSLLNSANYLKLSHFLSNLNDEQREATSDFLPYIFAFSSGINQIDEGIRIVQGKLEGKND